MASHAASQRPLSDIEKAMLEELGSHRLDDLPMDDGRFGHQADIPLRLPLPQRGPTNKWMAAIADGAFDDDDAMQVAGMESIAAGQLARIHRASKLAGMMVTIGYDDQRLRRGPSGQIDPRAQFHRGQKGPFLAGQAHQGDGPVQLPGKISDNRHTPAPPGISRNFSNASVSPGVHTVRRGPAPPGFGGQTGTSGISHTTHGVHPLQSSRPNPTVQPRNEVEPATAEAHKPGPLVLKQQAPKDVRLVLPDGASIFFQVNAEIASPTFMDRNAKFPGIVYLIAGRDPSDDQIMLRVNDERIEDVKHSPKEYGNLVTQSQEVILQFRTATGRTSWYVVKLRQRDDMISFVDALRKFVDQPNQTSRASSTAAVTDKGLIGANESSADATFQATVVNSTVATSSAARESGPSDASSTVSTSTPLAVHPSQHSQPTESPTSKQPLAAEATITSSQQQDATTTVPANLVEDIVTWVMNIVVFIRETGPAELARYDALPGIIRGTAAAVLLSRHSDFAKLDHQQRVAYIDQCCAPQVFDLFKRRLREHAARGQSDEDLEVTMPQDQTSQDVPASTPTKPHRVVYTAGELMRLRSTAKPPPYWLAELGFLKEATRSCCQQLRAPGLEWDEAYDAPKPDYKSQIQQIAANTAWLHNDRATESSPSSSEKDDLIGLFVRNTNSDAEALDILAAEDQVNIIRVLLWSQMTRVLKFRTTEDRDGALQRVADEYKTRGENWSKPFVEVFQRRERGGTNSSIRGSHARGSSRGSHGSPSPMNGLPVQTTQTGDSEAVAPTRAANVDDDMTVGSFQVQTPTTYGLAGDGTPARDPVSPSLDSHPTLGQLTSSLPPQAPAITVTAPGEQDSTAGASSASENLIQWDTEQEGPSDMTTGTEEPTSSALDEHNGLNASRFNADKVDLLGETSGLWTGVLAKNKSYMDDLMSIL